MANSPEENTTSQNVQVTLNLANKKSSKKSSKMKRSAKDSDVNIRLALLERQLFIGGLPSNINQEKFREWADEVWPDQITNAQLIYTIPEKSPARPRGFGFLTFCETPMAEAALTIRYRQFGHKMVELKKVNKSDFF